MAKRFMRRRLAVAGLATFLAIAVLGAAAPLLSLYPSLHGNLQDSLLSPSTRHLMGTDILGRDVFSEILWGARDSLPLALASVAAAVALGVLMGSVAGYFGGLLDLFLSRIFDALLVMPRVLVAMILVAALGSSQRNIVIALTVAFAPIIARLVRADYLSLKHRTFVDAARVVGAGNARIIVAEILPLTLPLITVTATFLLGQAVLAEAMFSFLGLNDPNISSWGKMVFTAEGYVRFAWWTAVFPGLAIVLSVLGLNLAGDGLNEVVNPKTARVSLRASDLALAATSAATAAAARSDPKAFAQ